MIPANDHARAKLLLEKQLDKTLSPQERDELDELVELYSDDELGPILSEIVATKTYPASTYPNYDWEAVRQKIVSLPHPAHQKSRLRFLTRPIVRYAAAAVFLFAIAGAVVWWETSRSVRNDGAGRMIGSQRVQDQPGQIQTGGQETNCGLVEPTQKEREKDNRLIHLSIHDGIETLSISPGWQFHTTLPDGSEVVLNAASSVTYPGSFEGLAKREVEVQGEVFFDVAQKAHQPFFVRVKGVELQALGTSFNVNAYGDKDSVYTTLVSGSLKAVKGGSSALLRPGQRAVIALKDSSSIKVDKANLTATGMWREGYFFFKQSRIDEVMRELGRWYKWDIRYSPAAKSTSFSGTFCRRTSEADVLETLKAGGIHFQKTGNTILIQ